MLEEDHSYTIVIGPPVVATTGLPNGFLGTPYSATLSVGGATGAVTWSLNTIGHPALSWLSVSVDGVLSGTPIAYQTTPPFTVTATDSLNQVASRSLSIFVSGPLDMTPLREGIVLEGPSSINFVGGNGTRTATLTGGSLPPGLTLNANGTWIGTPTRHGTYNFTLELRDCQSGSCGSPTMLTKNIQWQVSAKDQQGAQGPDGTVSFGGASGRQIAQVFTVGAQGALTGISLSQLTCSIHANPADDRDSAADQHRHPGRNHDCVRHLDLQPVCDSNESASPGGHRREAGVRAELTAGVHLTNTFAGDAYNAGDAYSLVPPGNWVSLFSASGRRDVPSFRTLIHPGMPVTYHNGSRNSASATLLGNGKVLIAGGVLAAELYDPALAQTQTPASAGNMVVQRQGHTATLLTNGTVVMIGGRNAAVIGSPKVASAEIYTSGSGFAATTGGMTTARDNHRAARYTDPNDGREKILVTGGTNSSGATLNTTEIYDTVTKSFSTGPTMLTGRQSHAAVTLGNGKILLAGGHTSGGSAHAELYNPATNTFAATPNMVVSNRGNVSATLLTDGNVLITGGQSGDVREEAEVYNAAGNTFSSTASPMLSKRMQHSTTLLGDGSVLIVGGYAEQPQASYSLPLATMERYLPGTNSFVSAGAMETRRERTAVVTTAASRVLIAGGTSQSWMSANTAEIYDQTTSPYFTPTTPPNGTPGTPYAHVYNGQGGTGGPVHLRLRGPGAAGSLLQPRRNDCRHADHDGPLPVRHRRHR